MKKTFIIYPKTKIDKNDPHIHVINAPIKERLHAYITGYKEDYRELPSKEKLMSLFKISKRDAEIALLIFEAE
jgi:hypothetical protein